MRDEDLHRTLRRQIARSSLTTEQLADNRVRDLLHRVSSAYDDADKQRYLHDRAFLLASTEMQTLYDRLQQATQSAATVQRDRLQAVFDSAATGLVVLEGDGRIFDINQVAEDILGVKHDSPVGTSLASVLLPASELDTAMPELRLAIREGSNWRSPDTLVTNAEGVALSVALFYRAMPSGGGVLAIEDITERKEAQAQLLWRANHDSLTGLLNRPALMEQIQRALQRGRRYGHNIALLFLDLDRFKRVNDTLGHAAGDMLLQECARRIRTIMREVDTVARLGGDEFVVVCENLSEEHEAFVVADRLVEAVSGPYHIGDDVAFVDASIGIAISEGHGAEPDQLLRDADVALYEAKTRAGSSIIAYRDSMIASMHHALDLERRLRRGLTDDEFWVVFQPIVKLPEAEVVGFEALARWTSDGKHIPPDEFIPVAEGAALLDEIGRRVIEQALNFLSMSPGDCLLFVNVSPSQVAAEGFADWLTQALATTGTDPRRLFLEVTEMLAMTDAGVFESLAELRSKGLRIALDDFGTGHSSLASLHNLPVDVLKIDRSLLADAAHDTRALEITRAICDLGHRLGIHVVAEGVETSAQVEILDGIGCRWAQGFHFGRPASAAEHQGQSAPEYEVESP